MLRYLAAGAVLVVVFIVFRACVAPVPKGQPIQDLSKITSGHDNVRLEPPPQPQEKITCFPDGTGIGYGYRDFREEIKRLCSKTQPADNADPDPRTITTGTSTTCIGTEACRRREPDAGITILPNGSVVVRNPSALKPGDHFGDGSTSCGGGIAVGASANAGCQK